MNAKNEYAHNTIQTRVRTDRCLVAAGAHQLRDALADLLLVRLDGDVRVGEHAGQLLLEGALRLLQRAARRLVLAHLRVVTTEARRALLQLGARGVPGALRRVETLLQQVDLAQQLALT